MQLDVIKFIITALLVIVIDSVYLNISSKHYNNIVSNIQGSGLKLNMIATFMSYITIIVGLFYFIIKDKRSHIDAAILGWIIYLIFDFTNKAIFNEWSWMTVVIDGIWGGILFGTTTYIINKLFL